MFILTSKTTIIGPIAAQRKLCDLLNQQCPDNPYEEAPRTPIDITTIKAGKPANEKQFNCRQFRHKTFDHGHPIELKKKPNMGTHTVEVNPDLNSLHNGLVKPKNTGTNGYAYNVEVKITH